MVNCSSDTMCLSCGIGSLPDPQNFRSPRVSTLLHQNGYPETDERAAFESIVKNGEDVLVDLDMRIDEARQLLESLLIERRRATTHIDDAKTILHPVRALSDDILHEIFSWCVYDWDDIVSRRCYPHESLNTCHPPWTLACISRKWRDITLSSPLLWSTLILDFPKYAKAMVTERMCLFRLGIYLQRSKDCDLSVSIHSRYPSILDHPPFTLLAVSASRWKHLRVNMGPISLQDFSGSVFLRLNTLYVRFNGKPTSSQRRISVDTFQTAPHLQYFSSTGDVALYHTLHLPWSKLTTYACDDTASERSWDVLRKLKATTTLILRCQGSADFPDSPVVMVSVLRVTVEEKQNSLTGSISRVFQCLQVPSLKHLNLIFPSRRIIQFPDLGASSASLTSIQLSCNFLYNPENTACFIRFLETAIHVESLCLHMSELPINLLIGLTRMSDHDLILPALRILTLSPHVPRFEPKLFFWMLESRYEDRNDGGSDISNSPGRDLSVQRELLQELRFKSFSALPFNSLDDHMHWDRICKELKVIYESM
ncbi:uncharacterized protein ARMOST_14962 [Armillaria ostoyae]|uniref:F-box domain-containing protein n=1 Tax=Armillaria ostoyae TaxID=47428 RepID=A0A284RS18_ARMOS|nr:uncharacterized protein ARMOST_14962 [Armillaria ostoyae]